MRAGENSRTDAHRTDGFTLIELLVVLSIIALLLTIALPRYFRSVDVAKEAVLVENLRITRATIDKYYSDTGKYPETLADLVSRRYLKALPFDPLTEGQDTWLLLPPEDTTKGGVFDLRSSAPGAARDGTPYRDL